MVALIFDFVCDRIFSRWAIVAAAACAVFAFPTATRCVCQRQRRWAEVANRDMCSAPLAPVAVDRPVVSARSEGRGQTALLPASTPRHPVSSAGSRVAQLVALDPAWAFAACMCVR